MSVADYEPVSLLSSEKRLLSGERQPDLSRLPPELARAVRDISGG